jgi:hypothetical protein
MAFPTENGRRKIEIKIGLTQNPHVYWVFRGCPIIAHSYSHVVDDTVYEGTAQTLNNVHMAYKEKKTSVNSPV